MSAGKNSARLLDEETGKYLLYSRIPGYSYGKVRHTCKLYPEISTVSEFKKYHDKMVENRRISRQTAATSKIWDTPYGKLTTLQVHERHEHKDNISLTLISNRLTTRGGMCPSLWWPKMHGSTFRVRLIKEGISEPNWTNCKQDNEVVNDSKNDQKINRNKTCFRDNGLIICKHYEKRLNQYNGHPKECDVASGNKCDNFIGEGIKTRLNCSGRPVRLYSLNGTSK